MVVLEEKETGLGGKYCLVDYGNGKFAFGTKSQIYSKSIIGGIPMNQYGTKIELQQRLESLIDLCVGQIMELEQEFYSNPTKGLEELLRLKKLELKALEEFYKMLSD